MAIFARKNSEILGGFNWWFLKDHILQEHIGKIYRDPDIFNGGIFNHILGLKFNFLDSYHIFTYRNFVDTLWEMWGKYTIPMDAMGRIKLLKI